MLLGEMSLGETSLSETSFYDLGETLLGERTPYRHAHKGVFHLRLGRFITVYVGSFIYAFIPF
jgi:hypothetical protein